MKKGMITMMAMLLGMSSMMAQISGMIAPKTVVASGAGDVIIRQGDALEVKCGGEPITFTLDNKIVLSSYKDYEVTLPSLETLRVTGAGDVQSAGVLTFPNLHIVITGVGDAHLSVDCDTITATLTGIGDLVLNGHCRYLEAKVTGLGEVDFDDFKADSLSINKTQSREVYVTRSKGPVRHESLLFDPNWEGFEAGLNMLLGPGPNTEFTGEYALLEQRTMSSWNFNFNIVDVGLAFTHSHRAGIFTGIGFGWNNYRFNNPVRLEKGADRLICKAIDETVEGRVKKSKLGVLYLQAPVMFEVRPTRKTFIDFGVTGGIRINAWNKVKYENGVKIKTHEDYYINRFKLDASLRAGGNSFGFYANYNLLPLFAKGKAQEAHCLSFGLSLIF